MDKKKACVEGECVSISSVFDNVSLFPPFLLSQNASGHSYGVVRAPDVSRKIRRKKQQNFNLQ